MERVTVDGRLGPHSETPASTALEPGALSAEGAFERAVWPHYPAIVRRLVLVVGSRADAEDIAQETLLRAWSAWARFDGRDVRAWLYTIALRLAFNQRRRWLRLRLSAAGDRAAGERAAWDDHVDPDLAAALRTLGAKPRAALLLNAVDGYTQREIAAMLGVREGTVASWISRARSTLRAQLSLPAEPMGQTRRSLTDPDR